MGGSRRRALSQREQEQSKARQFFEGNRFVETSSSLTLSRLPERGRYDDEQNRCFGKYQHFDLGAKGTRKRKHPFDVTRSRVTGRVSQEIATN